MENDPAEMKRHVEETTKSKLELMMRYYHAHLCLDDCISMDKVEKMFPKVFVSCDEARKRYHERYPDITPEAFPDPLVHFLNHGKDEGRLWEGKPGCEPFQNTSR